MSEARKQWKTALLQLPDPSFFEIIRNYLGPVKTPYNKHRLIDALIAKVERNKERLLSYIDAEDSAVLTAIHTLKKTDGKTLHRFFGTDKKYIELHLHLLNLEERLLICRNPENECYYLNPLFKEELLKSKIHPGFLLNARPAAKPKAEAELWLGPQTVFAAIAFLHSTNKSFNESGKLRKNARDALIELIPVLANSTTGIDRSERLAKILINSGLVKINGNGKCRPQLDFFENYDFNPAGFALWVAGSFAYDPNRELVEQSMDKPLQIINHVLAWLPAGNEISRGDLGRVIRLSEENLPPDFSENFIDGLKELNIILENEGKYFQVNPNLEKWLHYMNGPAKFIINSVHEATVPLNLGPDLYLFLTAIGEVKKSDIYSIYEINKAGILRAYNLGLDNKTIAARLNEASDHSLPENFKISLSSWAEEFGKIKIFKGLTLVLNKDIAEVVEKAGILDRWIIERISDGIYLMNEHEEKSWRAELTKCGTAPPPETVDSKIVKNKNIKLESEKWNMKYYKNPSGQISARAEYSGPDYRQLETALQNSRLTEAEKEEFKARLQKKLILEESQLKPGILKEEKSEAKGLDYLGKLRIIEQALKSGNSLLEVLERGGDGNPRKDLLQPLEIEKNGADIFLLGRTLPDFLSRRIAVRKISLVRKLKGSIYAP